MRIYRLRELREQAGLTQQQLADKALLARTTIVRIENDQIGARLPIVKRLARALKIKPIELTRDPAASETTTPTTTPSPHLASARSPQS